MTAAPRSLGLVAIATWLLIDSLRATGPVLLDLAEPTSGPAFGAIAATLAGGAVVAWVASLAAQYFSHGGTVWFLLGVTAVFRIGLPFLDGGWLIGATLYLAALAVATVILAARVAMGNGGGPTLIAGTSLGAAAAVVEQTLLRTLDAVWRDDVWGWVALGAVAALAVFNGWRGVELKPAEHTRGWWAYGLFLALTVYAFANVGYVASQTDLRMAAASALALVGLLLAARVGASAGEFPGGVAIAMAAIGVAGVAVLALVPGTAASIALPVAAALSAFAAAASMRVAPGSAGRSLGASLGFVALLGGPLVAAEVDRIANLPIRHGILITTVGIVLMCAAALRAWRPDRLAVAPGVLPRIAVGVVVGVATVWWTHSQFEQERTYSENFLASPAVMSWNLHHSVTPSGEHGPGVNAVQVASTMRDNPADVTMLQEVERGGLVAGGLDMVEYLAGDLELPYVYAGAQTPQTGNAIIASRPFSEPRSVDLTTSDGPARGAVAITFMGATYVSTHIGDEEADAAAELRDWVGAVGPVVIGGDLGDATQGVDATTVAVLVDAGYTPPTTGLPADGLAAVAADNDDVRLDFIIGREVELTDFTVLDVPWSDHRPLTATAKTGLSGTIAPEAAEENESLTDPTMSPDAGASPTASTSPTAGTTGAPSVSPSATPTGKDGDA